MKPFHTVVLCSLLILVCAVSVSCTTIDRLQTMQSGFTSVDGFFEEHHIPRYASTLPVLYNTGMEWNQHSIELIEGARDYILISIFLGNLHETTTQIWDLLAKKICEGVRVYCIIDSSSYFQMVPETDTVVPAVFNHLKELGIPVVEYNPFSMGDLFSLPTLLDRDHRKFWIVDGQYLAVGGININYTSLGLPEGVGNIDTMAEVSSPGAIGDVMESFVRTWNAYSPQILDTDDFTIPKELPQPEADLASLWLIDQSLGKPSQVTDMFDALIMGTQKELWLVQGYAFPTKALLNRIAYAVQRGVEVHVVFSDFARKPNYEMAARYGMLDLIDAGAKVHNYTSPIGAFLHFKLIMGDRHLVALGSVNYNLRSQTLSQEISVVFDDSRVGAVVMEQLDGLMEYTREVTRQEALEYRTPLGFLYFMLMQVWG